MTSYLSRPRGLVTGKARVYVRNPAGDQVPNRMTGDDQEIDVAPGRVEVAQRN
jgi:hypothetical protein